MEPEISEFTELFMFSTIISVIIRCLLKYATYQLLQLYVPVLDLQITKHGLGWVY